MYNNYRHCEQSEAIQFFANGIVFWIATPPMAARNDVERLAKIFKPVAASSAGSKSFVLYFRPSKCGLLTRMEAAFLKSFGYRLRLQSACGLLHDLAVSATPGQDRIVQAASKGVERGAGETRSCMALDREAGIEGFGLRHVGHATAGPYRSISFLIRS